MLQVYIKYILKMKKMQHLFAGVMELADVTDSKSVGSDIVSVRVRPPAPQKSSDLLVTAFLFVLLLGLEN